MKRDQEQHGAYADFVDILLEDFENARRQDRDEDQLNMRLEQNDAGEEGIRQVEESESASVTSESDVGADGAHCNTTYLRHTSWRTMAKIDADAEKS